MAVSNASVALGSVCVVLCAVLAETVETTAFPEAPALPAMTWGFNYDHFAPIVVNESNSSNSSRTATPCLMVLEDLLALADTPAMNRAVDAHLHRDFKAMRLLNATAVRLFLSLGAVLATATAPNTTALARLQRVVDIAAEEQLLVDLTGLAVMRPDTVPVWLTNASDSVLRASQRMFWHVVAVQFAGQSTILSFNLINEPNVPSRHASELSIGCVYMGQNTSSASCKGRDTICYCANLWRNPSPHCDAKCTADLVRGWCSEMSGTIKAVDGGRRVTFGDMAFSMGTLEEPRCTLADGLDYYSLHMQPPQAGTMTLDQLRAFYTGRINALPDDGGLVVAEEMYPFPQCPGNGNWLGPPGVGEAQLLNAYLNATRPRTVGWMAFYWGTAEALSMPASAAATYTKWLQIWASVRP